MTLVKLFISFIQVGLLSFGGGYAAIKLIETQVVHVNGWIAPSVFADLVTIAEMTPGPIAINAATFVGLRVGGVFGAVLTTLGCVLPSIIISLVLARLYLRFRENRFMDDTLSCLRPAVVALITSAFLSIFWVVAFGGAAKAFSNLDWMRLGLFALAFAALRAFKQNPIMVMLAAGAVNLVIGVIMGAV